MSNKASKEGKFARCIKAPIRILSRARDLYVKSMSDCAANVGTYGSMSLMGCPTPQVSTSLPRIFSAGSSASSNTDGCSELMRLASTRNLGKKIELETLRQQQSRIQSPTSGGVNVVPRNHTVAIGRIDEDKACEFGEDIQLKTTVFPGSRSHAVKNRRFFS
ncbi:hypothetical protein ACH5RR_011561 [Cinchona calisaya]|uniref:Uncharacterized protein n=1 Tax=Cinchona calisaya TaxID=153742 RepID=A0ABD3A8V0_9GENT